MGTGNARWREEPRTASRPASRNGSWNETEWGGGSTHREAVVAGTQGHRVTGWGPKNLSSSRKDGHPEMAGTAGRARWKFCHFRK